MTVVIEKYNTNKPSVVFAFLPRTASNWTRRALVGLFNKDVHASEYDVSSMQGGLAHASLRWFSCRLYKVGTIRHPISWYQSVWAKLLTRTDGKLFEYKWFVEKFGGNPFSYFVDQQIESGCDLYRNNVNSLFNLANPQHDFVVHYENLVPDVLRAISNGLCLDVSEEDLRRVAPKPVNEAPPAKKAEAVYARGQEQKVLDSTKDIVDLFYGKE